MTEEVQNTETQAVDQLRILKDRADLMGISYPKNAGVDKMRELIKAAQEPEEVIPEDGDPKQSIRQQVYNEAMRLVRVRISNMNPAKADLPGELFTVTNKYLGTVTRFVPYTEHDAWHVEKCIYDLLEEKKFNQVKAIKTANGEILPQSKWVREFSLERLPDLTLEELKILANQQAAADGMATN